MLRFTFLRIRAGHERCIPCADAARDFLCPLGMRCRVAVVSPATRQLPRDQQSPGPVLWLQLRRHARDLLQTIRILFIPLVGSLDCLKFVQELATRLGHQERGLDHLRIADPQAFIGQLSGQLPNSLLVGIVE
jgi:hypothetical protein